MAKARFMSMKWLRLHLKEIIWATVSLFVLSCFIIGYGTSRTQKQIDEKRRKADAAERKTKEAEETIPSNLVGKMALPALSISYPTAVGSISKIIDVQTIYSMLSTSPEYRRLMAVPAQLRATFGAQIKDNAVDAILGRALVEMYAQANNVKPQESGMALVEKEKARLGPAEFERTVRREGTLNDMAARRVAEKTIEMVYQSIVKPLASTTVTDEYLQKYYTEHKLRFKKDDEITLSQILLAPAEFKDKIAVAEDEIRRYYDEHRTEFSVNQRASVRQILVNPEDPEYLKKIIIDDIEVKKYYTEKIDQYKKPEQVRARHILFSPRTKFEKKLDTFTVNLRDFKLEDDGAQKKYSFEMAISEMKSDLMLNQDDVTLITADGKKVKLTTDSMAKAKNPIKFPVSGSPVEAMVGECCLLLPKDAKPATLEIKDAKSVHTFEVGSAHDEEKALEAAKVEAEKVLARIHDGADFAKLATELSDDQGSKASGGDLGFFSRGRMVKPFEDACFEAGSASGSSDIKGPIKSNFGYHLIKVEERQAAHTSKLEEVKDKIITELKTKMAAAKAENDLEACRETLDQKSRSMVELVQTYSMGESKKRNGALPMFFKGEITDDYAPEDKKLLEQEIGDNGRIIDEIEEVVFGLKAGEVSRVVKSRHGFHLFQLDFISSAPVTLTFTANLKEKIKGILVEKKTKEFAQKKADELAKEITSANFNALASEAQGAAPVELGPLPFSSEIGFSNLAITGTVGQLTIDGRTYLPAIQKAIGEFIDSGAYKKAEVGPNASGAVKILGPISTDLGFHFLKISSVKADQYEPFDKVKEQLREMLTQESSSESIAQDFEKNKEKYDQPATRKIRHIVVSEEDLAKDLHKRLLEGEIFGLLAKKFSIDSSSGAGGLLGDVKRGQLPPALDEQVWKLKKGEFTAPVQTNYGYEIVMLEENENPGKKAELSGDLKEKIKKKMRMQLANELFEGFLNELKRRASIIRHPVIGEI